MKKKIYDYKKLRRGDYVSGIAGVRDLVDYGNYKNNMKVYGFTCHDGKPPCYQCMRYCHQKAQRQR